MRLNITVIGAGADDRSARRQPKWALTTRMRADAGREGCIRAHLSHPRAYRSAESSALRPGPGSAPLIGCETLEVCRPPRLARRRRCVCRAGEGLNGAKSGSGTGTRCATARRGVADVGSRRSTVMWKRPSWNYSVLVPVVPPSAPRRRRGGWHRDRQEIPNTPQLTFSGGI